MGKALRGDGRGGPAPSGPGAASLSLAKSESSPPSPSHPLDFSPSSSSSFLQARAVDEQSPHIAEWCSKARALFDAWGVEPYKAAHR